MTEPAEVVATLFSAAVGILMIYTFTLALAGKEIAGVIDMVSSFAVPFMALLIVVFILFSVINEF